MRRFVIALFCLLFCGALGRGALVLRGTGAPARGTASTVAGVRVRRMEGVAIERAGLGGDAREAWQLGEFLSETVVLVRTPRGWGAFDLVERALHDWPELAGMTRLRIKHGVDGHLIVLDDAAAPGAPGWLFDRKPNAARWHATGATPPFTPGARRTALTPGPDYVAWVEASMILRVVVWDRVSRRERCSLELATNDSADSMGYFVEVVAAYTNALVFRGRGRVTVLDPRRCRVVLREPRCEPFAVTYGAEDRLACTDRGSRSRVRVYDLRTYAATSFVPDRARTSGLAIDGDLPPRARGTPVPMERAEDTPALADLAHRARVFAPDGTALVTLEGGAVSLVDATTGAVRWRTVTPLLNDGAVSFSPRGRWIIVHDDVTRPLASSHPLVVLDARDGRVVLDGVSPPTPEG